MFSKLTWRSAWSSAAVSQQNLKYVTLIMQDLDRLMQARITSLYIGTPIIMRPRLVAHFPASTPLALHEAETTKP